MIYEMISWEEWGLDSSYLSPLCSDPRPFFLSDTETIGSPKDEIGALNALVIEVGYYSILILSPKEIEVEKVES